MFIHFIKPLSQLPKISQKHHYLMCILEVDLKFMSHMILAILNSLEIDLYYKNPIDFKITKISKTEHTINCTLFI
jgi:hypothetical protein